MKSNRLRMAAAALLPAVATMLFVQACGGSGGAIAQAAPDPIEGLWDAVVTQRDCTSNATLATFRGMQLFHAGGTLTDTTGSSPALRGTGLGLWTRSGTTYTAKLRFYRYNADGSLAGSSVVTRTISLAADSSAFSSSNRIQVLDLGGAVVAEACAADAATKFR